MADLYPKHKEALYKAGLSQNNLPTLDQVWKENDSNKDSKEEKEEQARQRNRNVYFCVGYCGRFWETPIHKKLSELQNRYNLKWLRVSMSYHRFTNLRETFQGDLSKKLTKGVQSINFMDHVTIFCHR